MIRKMNSTKTNDTKTKLSNKSPYMFFKDDELQRLMGVDTPITNKSKLNSVIKEQWVILKKAGGVKYDRYISLSKGEVQPPTYEITKPYHKFCVQKRALVEKEFDSESAGDITLRLSEMWKGLSRTDKSVWDL